MEENEKTDEIDKEHYIYYKLIFLVKLKKPYMTYHKQFIHLDLRSTSIIRILEWNMY